MRAVAIVTGAARGIGLSIARRLAADGFAVVATDLRVDGLADEIAAHAGRDQSLRAIAMDVTDRQAVRAVATQVGPVSVIVNNAGVAAPMLAFDALDDVEWRRVGAVNIKGTFIVAQEMVRGMEPGGRIINIASRGYLGGAGASHYVASKAAVVGLTRALAIELRWQGITVNAIAPGMVDTDMIADFKPHEMAALLTREPSGAAARPETIASVVSFLASSESALVNGQVLFADGGKTVGMPLL